MFVCFHAGGLRSQIYLIRIPHALCQQAVLLCFSCNCHYLSAGIRHITLLTPGRPASSSSSSWGQYWLGHFLLFLLSPRYSLGSTIAELLRLPRFHFSSARSSPRWEVGQPGKAQGTAGAEFLQACSSSQQQCSVSEAQSLETIQYLLSNVQNLLQDQIWSGMWWPHH